MGFFFSRHESICSNSGVECRTPKEVFMKKALLIMAFLLFTVSALAEEKRYPVPLGDSPTLGPLDAPVTIVEFLDFQ
jgi:hypothetical protein